MAKQNRARMDAVELNRGKGYSDTPPDNLPHLGRLFELMDSGVVPNWMEIWLAISEYVAFSTKDDSTPDGSICDPQNMSQKICRFCA